MSSPQIAIVTRTRDRPTLLRRTMQSVLEQSHQDWLWVVVNSGDPAPVEALVEENSDALGGRAKLIHLEQQPLMGAASNVGIDGSDSQYITLLDDDDTWDPSFLGRAIGLFENRPAAEMRGVVTQTMRIDEDGEFQELQRKPFNPQLEWVNLFELASVNRFTVNAFVYERSAFEEVGPYREDLPVLDDWDFNLRFLRKFDVAVIPEPLANYHFRPDVTVGAGANSQIAGESLHHYYQAAIINGHLRDDLESGQAGMGLLMAAAGGHHGHEAKLKQLLNKFGKMSTKIGRIDSRTKEMKDRLNK